MMFAAVAARFSIPLVLLLIGLALGATGGYRYADAQGAAALADLQRQQAEQHAQAETLLRAELEAAHEEGEKLSSRLMAAQSQRHTKTIEVIRHAPSVTAGHLCLNASAVGVLNAAITPSDINHAVPEASGSVAGAPAAVAASDRDVYDWIAAATGQCGGVIGQLNALIDFEERRRPVSLGSVNPPISEQTHL